MRLIRQLHLYTGLTLSLVLFLIALSGAALLYKLEYWQLQYPALRGVDALPGSDNQAQAIAAASRLFGDRLESLKMPEPGVSAYHAYLADHGEALMTIDTHALIDEWQLRDRLMGVLFDIHVHLMAGETGELVAGGIGLVAAVMAITGLALWWPTRRAFRWRSLWPGGWQRRHLLAWHRDMGMVLSPLLLVFLLTGSGMVFYAQVQSLLNGLFGDPVPTVAPASAAKPVVNPETSSQQPLPSARTLAAVNAVFPDARLMFYYTDALAQGYHRFRLRRACELHPNGLTFIYTNAVSGDIAHTSDACAMPPGERLTRMIYPLHAGKAGTETWRFLGLITALVLVGLSLSGVATYIQRIRNANPRSRASHTSL
ncbi:MAG: PepSY-associated TM helix domain-containing protein [Pseudohongiellaceae bacterium]|nr:MAG: hypothetical protein A3H44_04845 [Gammaproteobacteria bacterium RIFCSPLOWO2_02_FULL_57_10]